MIALLVTAAMLPLVAVLACIVRRAYRRGDFRWSLPSALRHALGTARALALLAAAAAAVVASGAVLIALVVFTGPIAGIVVFACLVWFMAGLPD